ncbi:TlpA family protein disulfide reductase [Nocardioides jiangxiensis]|uniref:TlpA disulfide reductase family protein n=1 Tax=Nocardioides jiangxiensis TaxID=3064524 RepID=A0ABT9B139_9ACTN|nr:TlpA disulfide reductase family protein [Nocardioides sp. WY-20]MDO7868450.1 TlpA disulfide reductase family protein [Nocardioides sp. WY-20]
MRRQVVVAAAALALSACAPGAGLSDLGQRRIDVDTPALRSAKAQAHIATCPEPTTDEHAHDKDGLPAVTLPCLGGGPSVDLAKLRGPMVITFWASWCGPCRRELPIFQRFAQQYAGRVSVIGIDYNDVNPAAALELARTSGVRFPLLADTETAVHQKGGLPVNLLPTLAFVDADGELSMWHDEDGHDTGRVRALEIESIDELRQLAAEHLGPAALKPAPAASAPETTP